jgi:diadenosine tetraphosphate (Ap4A) HIT family hydrolase
MASVNETANDAQGRLLQVVAHAEFEVLPGVYSFIPLAGGPTDLRDDALACVRDGAGWSELVPADESAPAMVFKIFAFHFHSDDDATGFVGWLHSHLARTTGAGHIVVCGRSLRGGGGHTRGGIFDYWGCPADAAERVLAEIEMLRERGRRAPRPHVGPKGGCLLCEALDGVRGFPVIAESARAVAVLNEAGASSRGHCVFFPRRHAPRLDDLDTAEMVELFGLVHRVAKALSVEHYNVISNNGDRAGQTVFHAHAHIVPKPNAGTGLVQQVGLGVVDQGGMAEELKRRLGA